MVDHIAVPPELESVGQSMLTIAGTVEGELARLKSTLDALQDTWKGQAQNRYHDLQQEWNVAADGLFSENGVLGQIAQTMNLNWNNYTECEWSNIKTWAH